MEEQMTDQDNRSIKTNREPCPICGGVGYVRANVPMGHPQFGKAIPCRCKEQERFERRFERLRQSSNLRYLEEMTFETFVIEENASPSVASNLTDAKNTAMTYAKKPEGWLLFTGPYGCGKTHLAVAIANKCIQRSIQALFVVVPDLLDYLRAAYAPSSSVTYDQRFEEIRNVEMLILDDLGTQNTTPWAAEKLYQILNYRYIAKLPTVITTNLALSDLDPRLASRLRDNSLVTPAPIRARDHRIGGTDDTFGSITPYTNMMFSTFQNRRDQLDRTQAAALQQAVQTVQEFTNNPIGWLVLRGSYGTGKTHLAAAAAYKLATGGANVMFVVASDLLDHLRATFQPGSAVSYDRRFNKVSRTWLLVLDDLGSQSPTPWAQAKLFQIFNHRYIELKPTIVTISFSDWENLDPRLKSRFGDPNVCTIVDLDLPSYRGATPKTPPRRTTRQRFRG